MLWCVLFNKKHLGKRPVSIKSFYNNIESNFIQYMQQETAPESSGNPMEGMMNAMMRNMGAMGGGMSIGGSGPMGSVQAQMNPDQCSIQ